MIKTIIALCSTVAMLANAYGTPKLPKYGTEAWCKLPRAKEVIRAAETVKWWEFSADQGNVGALKDMGLLHLKGEVTGKPDVPQAIKYLEKAAERGNGQALFLLGEIYEQGRNGKVDKDRAIKYYKAAAIQHPDITKMPGEAAGAAASQSDPKRK